MYSPRWGWNPAGRDERASQVLSIEGENLPLRMGNEPDIPLLSGAMLLQGFGVGLFQVAYFDIATSAIPRADRGVAGSLVMMTRTIGTVTGATLLMLVFQTLRGHALAGGANEVDAFIDGFAGTFRFAAILPAALVVLCLARGWARLSEAGR